MFKHPTGDNTVTSITNVDEKMIQPNTIDLRIKSVNVIGSGPMHMDEHQKIPRKNYPLKMTIDENFGECFLLDQGRCYEIISDQLVTIGEGEMAILLGRSTFNRNGVLIISSVYDSGFKDYAAATCYNIQGETTFTPGTRFAHLIIGTAETIGKYDGDYGYHKT